MLRRQANEVAVRVMRPGAFRQRAAIKGPVAAVPDVGTGRRDQLLGGLVIGQHVAGGRFIVDLEFLGHAAFNLIGRKDREVAKHEEVLLLFRSRVLCSHGFGEGTSKDHAGPPVSRFHVNRPLLHRALQIAPSPKCSPVAATKIEPHVVEFEQQRIDAGIQMAGQTLGAASVLGNAPRSSPRFDAFFQGFDNLCRDFLPDLSLAGHCLIPF